MSDIFIYILHEPDDEKAVRYVGKTDNVAKRYANHLWETTNTHKSHWIQSLVAIGLKPGIKVVEILNNPTDDRWQFAELFWISLFREQGCKLTNATTGGNGAITGRPSASEAVERRAESNRGLKRSPEVCAKFSVNARLSALRGIDNVNGKLTDEQVVEIRHKFKSKISKQSELAHFYDVSKATICRIVRGRDRNDAETNLFKKNVFLALED